VPQYGNRSKSDMLDEELINDIKKELPPKVPHIFISSLTNKNLTELKDLLWKVLNEENVWLIFTHRVVSLQ
jgi:GTP-binding protein